MADVKKMFEICNYVVKNNARIIDVCEEFKVSRRTAQKYTGEYLRLYIEETNDELAKKLLMQLEKIKSNNEKETQTKEVDVDLNEVINYIISTKNTIKDASLAFGISESTIHKYISRIKENDKELYDKLKDAQKEISKSGVILGGKTSVRGPKYLEEEVLKIAEYMISQGLSLDMASKKFNIPRSTLYELLRRINNMTIQTQLDGLFNRKNILDDGIRPELENLYNKRNQAK